MKIKCIVCVLLFFSLCGCDPYVYAQPYNYENSIWVCDEPEITYYVLDSPDNESYAVVKINGQDIMLDFGFRSTLLFAFIHDESESEANKECFTGTCQYSKEKFVVKVDIESDRLFGGKYETLVFKRMK